MRYLHRRPDRSPLGCDRWCSSSIAATLSSVGVPSIFMWASAKIVVERVSSIAGFNAVFRVMLDEHQVAVIPPGQTPDCQH
jgi:hypothetical protein